MFRRKKKEPPKCTFSQAQAVIEAAKPKTRFTTKLYFWLFILLTILAIFLFWSTRGDNFISKTSPVGVNVSIACGILAVCLGVFFGLICFVRFVRSRSIAGGLFLTTCISTGVFLGVSQLLPIVVPSTAAAFSAAPDVTNNGLAVIVGLAQIGLFAIWFVFLLFTIYLHVRPVKRIDKYLQKIVDGEQVKRVRLGKARQYISIAEKLKTLSQTTHTTNQIIHAHPVAVDTLPESTCSVQTSREVSAG